MKTKKDKREVLFRRWVKGIEDSHCRILGVKKYKYSSQMKTFIKKRADDALEILGLSIDSDISSLGSHYNDIYERYLSHALSEWRQYMYSACK